MSQYTAKVPSGDLVKPEIRSFYESFYAVSDTPDAHEKYATFFTQNARLIMASNEANGRDEILSMRKGMWEKVAKRSHKPEKIFSFGPGSNEVMLYGTVDYELKDGKKTGVEWSARARFVDEDGALKMELYQVYLCTTTTITGSLPASRLAGDTMAQRLGVGSSLFLFGAFMVKKLHHEPQAPRVVDPLFDYISTYTGTGHTNATMAPAGPEIAAVVTAAAVPLIAWGPLATALLLIAAMLLLARVSSLFVTKVTRNFARFARGGLGMVLAGLWFLLPLLYQMYGYYAVIDQFSGLLANFVDLPRTALLLAKLATAAMLTLLPALGDADAPGLLLLRIWKLGKDLDLETAGLREEREINRNLRQELEKAKDYAKRMLKITLRHESVEEDLELRLGEAEKARLSAMRKMNIRKDDAYRQMTTEIVSLKHRLHGAEVKARTVELNRDLTLNRDREKAKKDLLAIATKLEETEETSQARLERLNKVTQEVREVRDQLQAAKTGKTKAEEKNERQLDRLEQNKITAAQLNDKFGVAKKAQAAAEVWERRAVTAQEYLKAQLVMTKRELERAAETSKVQLKLSKQDAKEADELRAKLRASKEELEMTKKLGQGQLDQL
ncbi:hypothetical protein LTS09_004854 [Friedmanniomyces endolithicus]|nr:hypothetical protein LTS09_004854 [Friedmanniomyces endolithicus]